MKHSFFWRLRGAIFGAEQRALWPDPQRDGRSRRWARWSPVTIALVIIAWVAYWLHPGTWRRAPAHLSAFIRVRWRNVVHSRSRKKR